MTTGLLETPSFGLCRPRYATRRTPSRPTLGPRVGEVAEVLRKPFMPWQTYISSVALELNPDDIDPRTGLMLPAYQTVIIVVMRQNGKTELIFPVMVHRMIGFDQFGPQRVLFTAQTADDARKRWRDVHHARLAKSPYRALYKARLALNKEEFLWINGSTWSPTSTTAKTGGTGDSIDMGVIDEGWAADKRREAAMRPAMLTRPARQMWILSMVPGLSRATPEQTAFLRDKVKLGREAVRNDVRNGIAYFEFSADEEMDPADPDTWWSCMPALGHTITESAVRADFQAMDLVDFCAEYLGWWPNEKRASWSVIRSATWEKRGDPDSVLAGRPALALDAEEARDRAVIAAAGARPDGDLHVEIVEPGQDIDAGVVGMDWATDRIVEIYEAQDASTVVIDPRGPAQSFILQLRLRGLDVTTPNTLEVAGACARFYDATGEKSSDEKTGRRLWHIEQTELATSLSVAKKIISGKNKTFVWERGEGSGEIWAATLAMYGYETKCEHDYDARDSVAAGEGECPGCGAYPLWKDGPTNHYEDCTGEG